MPKTRLRGLALDLTPLRTSRDFRLVFAATGVSGFGSFVTYVTIPYQVYALTKDPLLVGLLGVCELVPLLVMAFVGGALADYLDRRLLVLGGEIGFTLLCATLLVNALTDRPHLWLLYLVAAATAALDGLQRPALEGLTPRIVAPDEIPAAGALNSLRMHAASLGGPALAGILIATVDLTWVYALDLATFAVSLTCLALVRAVPPPVAADRPSLRSVVTGLRYARSRPELLGMAWPGSRPRRPRGPPPVPRRRLRPSHDQCLPSANSSTILAQNAGRSAGLRLLTSPLST